MDVAGLKDRVVARVDELAGAIVEVSHDIHERPELGFEEHFASERVADVLEGAAFEVTRGAYGLDTAVDARFGADGPTVAICCEYDALPGVGHACGHNVIAAAGLGAALALAAVAEEAGGRVVVLGTPAEEGGAGKVLMIDQGALDGIDVAMMVHPADADLLWMDTLAACAFEVDYSGHAAHAAAFPHLGRNALDAAVLGYVNVAALRQHIRSDERAHGVFPNGGTKPNIVPDHTTAAWMVRAGTLEALEPLKARVLTCLEAGTAAAGCRMEARPTMADYADMVDDPVVLALYAENSTALGRPLADPRTSGTAVVGSTDMGNVSHLVPSIHPMIKVAPSGVSIHSHDFAGHARAEAGDRAVVDGAKAMAMTAVDLWSGPGLLDEVRGSASTGGPPS